MILPDGQYQESTIDLMDIVDDSKDHWLVIVTLVVEKSRTERHWIWSR